MYVWYTLNILADSQMAQNSTSPDPLELWQYLSMIENQSYTGYAVTEALCFLSSPASAPGSTATTVGRNTH